MTAIAGIAAEGRVYIGGDSLSGESTSHNKQLVTTPKVLRLPKPRYGLSEIIVGYSWSWRIGNLLEHALDLPDHKVRWAGSRDPIEYIVRHFVPAAQKVMAEAAVGPDDKLNVLIGYAGRLLEVQSDFSVLEPRDHYAAVGSGYQYALGSLHSTQGMEPLERIERALCAAEAHSAFVQGPFLIEYLDTPGLRAVA